MGFAEESHDANCAVVHLRQPVWSKAYQRYEIQKTVNAFKTYLGRPPWCGVAMPTTPTSIRMSSCAQPVFVWYLTKSFALVGARRALNTCPQVSGPCLSIPCPTRHGHAWQHVASRCGCRKAPRMRNARLAADLRLKPQAALGDPHSSGSETRVQYSRNAVFCRVLVHQQRRTCIFCIRMGETPFSADRDTDRKIRICDVIAAPHLHGGIGRDANSEKDSRLLSKVPDPVRGRGSNRGGQSPLNP